MTDQNKSLWIVNAEMQKKNFSCNFVVKKNGFAAKNACFYISTPILKMFEKLVGSFRRRNICMYVLHTSHHQRMYLVRGFAYQICTSTIYSLFSSKRCWMEFFDYPWQWKKSLHKIEQYTVGKIAFWIGSAAL